jgi:outer membrane lipoprotein-sorting protein
MLTIKSIYRIFPLVFLSMAGVSQDDVFRKIQITDEFRNTFTRKAENIHNMQAYFKQEKYISYLAASVISEGSFYYQKPNSVRWEFTNPYQYIIIVKNGELHIHDPRGEMIFKEKENEVFDHLNILVQNSLSGNVLSENHYKTSLMESEAAYKLTVIPDQEKIKELIVQVDIYFDKTSFNVESLVIFETSGDNTFISFSNNKYNTSLDNKLFE